MLKLLYIPSLNIPVCYWRIENYAETMVGMKDKVMVNVEYFRDIIGINMAWDDACVGKGELSQKIQTKIRNAFKFFDVIVFQRIQNMPALALIQEMRKEFPDTKIVAELDDSVGDVAPSSPYKWGDHHRWSAEHLHRSDAVICSTKYLADSIKPIIGDKPVHVAPNCINRKTWKIKKPKFSGQGVRGIRIGYVGGGAHDEDIRIVYRAILPILEKHKKVKLVIRYGGYRPNWLLPHEQIDFKSVGWCMEEYPQKLADMDIDLALAPLRDSEFNRCKSNLKWIEWSSIGVPLLASNVEPYKHTNGDLTLTDDNSVENWRDYLYAFIDYINQGKLPETKEVVKQNYRNYNLKKETSKVLNFLESLL